MRSVGGDNSSRYEPEPENHLPEVRLLRPQAKQGYGRRVVGSMEKYSEQDAPPSSVHHQGVENTKRNSEHEILHNSGPTDGEKGPNPPVEKHLPDRRRSEVPKSPVQGDDEACRKRGIVLLERRQREAPPSQLFRKPSCRNCKQ